MQKRNGFAGSIPGAPLRVSLVVLSLVALAVASNLVLSPIMSAAALQANEAQPIQTSTGQEPRNTVAKGSTEQLAPSSQTRTTSDEGLWRFIDETSLTDAQKANAAALPRHATARLDRDALTALLRQAPMEFTDSAKANPLVMTLPMPDGTAARFSVEESPIMEPGLAEQFPEVKTYRAQGIDDPTATARFDWMPLGFHAIVLSVQGTAFIEPLTEDDTSTYVSYFNHDVTTDNLSLSCLLSESEIAEAAKSGLNLNQEPGRNFVTGSTLRTYRLAVAATAEFSQQYGSGSAATTLMKITTMVNLVNAVFQKEATITFQLVANELDIIYTGDPTLDPYDNSSPMTMLAQNHNNLNTEITSANYDIGHVFGGIAVSPGFVSFSGIASLGATCRSSFKGQGVSTMGGGSASFPHSIFVSGVTHEMAHQFNAPHTFNSTTSGCSGNRDSAGAYEPGSGSTIMAYSICGTDDLQSLNDLYFHTGSIDRMLTYIGGLGNCAATTSTGHGPPSIPALTNFTIPANTPFTLTGSATDPDGDPLTYSWEEYDLGNASPPNTDDGTRPLFRSFPASTSPSRTFPSLQYILNNANVPPTSFACGSATCFTGQVLPSTTRTMNFRFTARDNRAAGGGTTNAASTVSVVSTAGPFTVTQPNTAISWSGGVNQTVTWNVANTASAPISAANVKISLSTDGGTTFPTVLAASTPNDGTESLLLPNVSTTTARVKVEAVGNIFFDISNTNFTITGGGGGISVTVQTSPAGRSFTVDGTTYTTAQTFTWTTSSSHTISTTTPQSGTTGTRYVWSSWSDAGAISHTVAPSVGTTYTANFTTQFFLTMTAGSGGTVTPASNWFNSGAGVTITGIPNGGFAFSSWAGSGSGSFTGSTNPSSVTMNGPITETGSFTPNTTGNRAAFDFDGDGKSDIGYYRNGLWAILKSGQAYGFGTAQFFSWGGAGLQPISADFDGDGEADLAYMVPPSGGQSQVYAILKSSTNFDFGQAQFVSAGFPALGDTPVVGDFDGDGRGDPGIWRSSNGVWIIPTSSSNYTSFIFTQWGQAGDTPIVADLDGDGRSDIGYYRNGVWGFLKSSQSYGFGSAQFFSWGGPGLQPIVGDFDGDDMTDLSYIVAPSGGQSAAYAVLKSSTNYNFGQAQFFSAGFPSVGDTPVVGDFDGDGKADPGIWRSSNGVWIIQTSSSNYASVISLQWGVSGDIRIPNRLAQD